MDYMTLKEAAEKWGVCIVIKYRHAPQQRQRFCLALFIHPTLYRLNYKVINRRLVETLE